MITIFDVIFYIIPYSFLITIFIVFALEIFNKKDKPIKKPFHRVLNWLFVASIPLFISFIFEGDHSFILIPIFI